MEKIIFDQHIFDWSPFHKYYCIRLIKDILVLPLGYSFIPIKETFLYSQEMGFSTIDMTNVTTGYLVKFYELIIKVITYNELLLTTDDSVNNDNYLLELTILKNNIGGQIKYSIIHNLHADT